MKNPIPREPSLLDILHVCLHMRPDEVEQFQQFFGDGTPFDPDRAAAMLYLKGGVKFVLYGEDGLPYCVGGYESVGPGVMQSWMAGTPEGWTKHWRVITRASRRVIKLLFAHAGVCRLQTNCLASRRAAMRWYRSLGLKQVGTVRAFAPNGDDLALFAIERGVADGQ